MRLIRDGDDECIFLVLFHIMYLSKHCSGGVVYCSHDPSFFVFAGECVCLVLLFYHTTCLSKYCSLGGGGGCGFFIYICICDLFFSLFL